MKVFTMIFYGFIFYVISIIQLSVTTKLTLDKNGKLQNLLIFINDGVEEEKNLVRNVERLMTIASESLFNATKQLKSGVGIMFGNVYIRVPQNFKIKAGDITWQQCVKADFQIDTLIGNSGSTRPFTKQIGKCGKPANFVRFPNVFFMDVNGQHHRAKEIIREFVKFRYGVFSEEPLRNVLFVFDGNKLIQNTCGSNINWKIEPDILTCSDKNKKCTYKIDKNSTHTYSLMFDAESSTSSYFCNDLDRPHNKLARNQHNIKCNRRSVSDVIESHEDFNKAISQSNFEVPKFHIVKAQDRKILFVVDTSGSMYPYFNTLKEALINFIEELLGKIWIGLVTFNDEASILSDFEHIDNETTKRTLIEIIKSMTPGGGTNIGSGLEKAIEILEKNNANDGSIILFSDGENDEDHEDLYRNAMKKVVDREIVASVVGFGEETDKNLTEFTKKTGGMFLFMHRSGSIMELKNKFTVRKTCGVEDSTTVVAKTGQIQIEGNDRIVNFTYIDQFVGDDTVITLNLEKSMEQFDIYLITPDKHRIPSSKRTNKTVSYQMRGRPIPGMYQLEFSRNTLRYKRSLMDSSISFTVSGKPARSQGLINPIGDISTTLLEKVEGRSYVTITIDLSNTILHLHFGTRVYVIVNYPSGRTKTYKLTDDGLGDDSLKSDKIYTRTIYSRDLFEVGFFTFNGFVEIPEVRGEGAITRTVEFESLRINAIGTSAMEDMIPPAQIINFKARFIDEDCKFLDLTFRAVGDDSMTGNIHLYQLRLGEINAVIENVHFHRRPYTKIGYTHWIDNHRENVKVFLRGVDENGNRGIWSPPLHVSCTAALLKDDVQ